jgi:RHS repeat-associated protein
MGKVTSTGASTITVNYSSSVSGIWIELSAKEFTAGLGASTTWTKDTAGGLNNASSSTVSFPSLTPAGSSELYFGFGGALASSSAGSTSGFSYVSTSGGNMMAYDPNVSSATSTTVPLSSAAVSTTVAALISASGSGSSCPTGSGSGSVPIVTNVSPCTGSTGGGTSVTITGANFTGITAVNFGSVPATSYTVVNSSTITAVAPTNSGSVDVTVTAGGMRLEELAAYSAYGVQTIQSGADVTPFGFQGSYTDPSGLIYLIGRYYDPATDQFLSVDPDVAETGQPYAFTGDDPLNETDPLGLTGSAKAHAIYENQVNANKKYCKAHPNATGHNCGGLLHEIRGTLDKTRHLAASVPRGIANVRQQSQSLPVIGGVNKYVDNHEVQVAGGAAIAAACVGTGGAPCVAATVIAGTADIGTDVANGCSAGQDVTDGVLGATGGAVAGLSYLGEAALDGSPVIQSTFRAQQGAIGAAGSQVTTC